MASRSAPPCPHELRPGITVCLRCQHAERGAHAREQRQMFARAEQRCARRRRDRRGRRSRPRPPSGRDPSRRRLLLLPTGGTSTPAATRLLQPNRKRSADSEVPVPENRSAFNDSIARPGSVETDRAAGRDAFRTDGQRRRARRWFVVSLRSCRWDVRRCVIRWSPTAPVTRSA